MLAGNDRFSERGGEKTSRNSEKKAGSSNSEGPVPELGNGIQESASTWPSG